MSLRVALGLGLTMFVLGHGLLEDLFVVEIVQRHSGTDCPMSEASSFLVEDVEKALGLYVVQEVEEAWVKLIKWRR